MGNFITNTQAGASNYLKLSNGATTVVLSVLALAGSDLASTQWEKELMTWLTEHDQTIFGLGVVGFDIDEIAWSKAHLTDQKAFLLKVIDSASTKQRWAALSYDPPFALEQLKALRGLVETYMVDYIAADKHWNWWVEPESFEKCSLHQIYMHANGCLICHDS